MPRQYPKIIGTFSCLYFYEMNNREEEKRKEREKAKRREREGSGKMLAYSKIFLPLIIRTKIAIMASTNNICINPPA